MKKKYVVLFVAAVADFKGGAEKCLQQFMENPSVEPILIVPAEGELSSYAHKHGISVHVIDFGMVNQIHRPFNLRSIFSAVRDALSAAWKIKGLAKSLNVDCIHSNGLKPHGILALGRFLGRTPIISHMHDIPYTSKEKLFWRFIGWTSHKVMLVSEHCWVSKKLPRNAQLVPNGIEVSEKSLLDIVPKFLSSSNTIIKLGFIGRIHPYKGLHLAIDWIAAARAAGINCELVIRGEAAPAEQQYLANVKKQIENKGLAGICIFEGRVIGMSKIYAGIDIVLMPSEVAEPFGLVAIESFDQGLPCFAYPSGALPTIIEDGVSGFLCKNSEDFVGKLSKLISSESEFNFIRHNAHKRLKENYSIENLYSRLDASYNFISGK